MREYRVLLLGHRQSFGRKRYLSVHMLTQQLAIALWRLPHVTVQFEEVKDCLERDLPKADFVVVVEYFALRPNPQVLKQFTGARKVTAFREVPFPEYDHTFDLLNDYPLPCAKGLMANVPKQPGLILVDHGWESFRGTDEGWTDRIETWLRDICGPQAEFWRLVYDEHDAATVPEGFRAMPYMPYEAYLGATATVERFVMTHRECHPWGAIDMAARGTQVLSPPGFTPPAFAEHLGIQTFSSKEELAALLAQPVGPEWGHKRDICTDYLDIAKAMDRKFQEWMEASA